MWRFTLLAALPLAACYEEHLVACADGRVCPANTVCVDPALGGCVGGDRAHACDGLDEGAPCELAGFSGVCTGGVCIPGDGPPAPRVKLVWGANGDGAVAYAPIGSEALRPETPMIDVGLLGHPLTPAPYGADGSFEVPSLGAGDSLRIVYSLPADPVLHEVQWGFVGSTLVEPRTTRLDAPAVPSGSGYRITPFNAPNGIAAPRIATSGVYTYDSNSANITISGTTLSYRFDLHANPMLGPSGAPQGSRGDWVLISDWAISGSSIFTMSGFAVAQNLDLAPSTLSSPTFEPSWQSTTINRSVSGTCPATCLPSFAISQTMYRLQMFGTAQSQAFEYGVAPPGQFALIFGGPPSYMLKPLIVPSVVMNNALPVATSFVDPSPMLGSPPVVYARFQNSRTVGSVTLTTALHVVMELATTAVFSAPLAVSIQLQNVDLGLSGSDNSLYAVAPMQKLTFSSELGYNADDFIVTLFEIAGGALVPRRTYLVTKPEVQIDGVQLPFGGTYVFSITSRVGIPGAGAGDYTRTTSPFSATTTWSRTFTVM